MVPNYQLNEVLLTELVGLLFILNLLLQIIMGSQWQIYAANALLIACISSVRGRYVTLKLFSRNYDYLGRNSSSEHRSFHTNTRHLCVCVCVWYMVTLLCMWCRYASVCRYLLYIVCVAANELALNNIYGQAIIIRLLETTSWLLPAISTCLFTCLFTSIV